MSNPLVVTSADIIIAFPMVTVNRQLPTGGQKFAFDATHSTYGRIALKVMQTSAPSDEERAIRELQTSTTLTRPMFSSMYDFGRVTIHGESLIYVIEEFLEGGSLSDLLKQRKTLSIDETLVLAEHLLAILTQVEAARIVHRDIKPANIMIHRGRYMLIDFGIARHLDLPSLTQDFAQFGPMTPGYAAPEQIRNEKRTISIQTDLFALGVVLYECIIGYNPFTIGCTSAAESLQRGLNLTPPPLIRVDPAVPVELSDLVSRLLSRAAHRRPRSASEVLQEIRALIASRRQP